MDERSLYSPEDLWLDYIYQWNPLMAEVDAAESCFILNSLGLKRCVKLYNELLFPVDSRVFKNELGELGEDDRSKALTCLRILNKCATLKREFDMQKEMEDETKFRFSQTISRRERRTHSFQNPKPNPSQSFTYSPVNGKSNVQKSVIVPHFFSEILGKDYIKTADANRYNNDAIYAEKFGHDNEINAATRIDSANNHYCDASRFGDVTKYKITNGHKHFDSCSAEVHSNVKHSSDTIIPTINKHFEYTNCTMNINMHFDDSPFSTNSASRSNSRSNSTSPMSVLSLTSRRSMPIAQSMHHVTIPENSILSELDKPRKDGEINHFNKELAKFNGNKFCFKDKSESASDYSLSTTNATHKDCVQNVTDVAIMKGGSSDNIKTKIYDKPLNKATDFQTNGSQSVKTEKRGVFDRLKLSWGSLRRSEGSSNSLRRSFHRNIRKKDIGDPIMISSAETEVRMKELGCMRIDDAIRNKNEIKMNVVEKKTNRVETLSVSEARFSPPHSLHSYNSSANNGLFSESFADRRIFHSSFSQYATMGRNARLTSVYDNYKHSKIRSKNINSNGVQETVSESSNILELDSILNNLYEDISHLDDSISALPNRTSDDSLLNGVTYGREEVTPPVFVDGSPEEISRPTVSTPGDGEADGDWIYPDAKERRDSGVGASLTRTFSKDYEHFQWKSFSQKSIDTKSRAVISVDKLSVDELTSLKRTCLLKISDALSEYVPSKHSASNWFKTPKARRTKTTALIKGKVFCRSLTELQIQYGQAIPPQISRLMRLLGRQAADCDGIFRKAGVKARVLALKKQLDSNSECEYIEDIPLYDIADLVKLFFREIPECLLTSIISKVLIDLFPNMPDERRREMLSYSILILPDENREALQALLYFLNELSKLASLTQMNANNLAVCFCPSLFNIWTKTSLSDVKMRDAQLRRQKIAHQCLTYMISNAHELFHVDEELLKSSSIVKCAQSKVKIEVEEYEAYFEANIPFILKLAKEKSKSWINLSVVDRPNVQISFNLHRGHNSLPLWRAQTLINAPPAEILSRLLHERHLCDDSVIKWRVASTSKKKKVPTATLR